MQFHPPFPEFFWKYGLYLTGNSSHHPPPPPPNKPSCRKVVITPGLSVIFPERFWDFISNIFVCLLPAFTVQSSAPVGEVTRSIIHLLRQVIKRRHSLPKLGLIIPAVQAVFPASCSSPLPDQDIHPKESLTYWRLQFPAVSSNMTKASSLQLCQTINAFFPAHHMGLYIYIYTLLMFRQTNGFVKIKIK